MHSIVPVPQLRDTLITDKFEWMNTGLEKENSEEFDPRIPSEENSVPKEQSEALLQRNHTLVHPSDRTGSFLFTIDLSISQTFSDQIGSDALRLFLIHFNDIHMPLRYSKIITFADDKVIFTSSKNLDAIQHNLSLVGFEITNLSPISRKVKLIWRCFENQKYETDSMVRARYALGGYPVKIFSIIIILSSS